MKSLMLLNARRRRKSRRSRKSRRNPFGATAAYRAGFPKSMGPKRRKSTRRRRRVLSIRRYRLPGGRAGLAVRARKIYVSRRGRKAAIIVARNPRRRHRRSYRMNPMGGNIMSQVKGVFSKENLTIAGGGVAAAILTNKLLSMQKADKTPVLPMGSTADTQKLARLAYAIAIPAVGAIATRRFNPALAKGMLLGGLINGLIEGIKSYAPDFAKTAGLAEYLDYTPMSAVGATPGYSAINQFSTVRPMNSAFSNSSAFPADAWGR